MLSSESARVSCKIYRGGKNRKGKRNGGQPLVQRLNSEKEEASLLCRRSWRPFKGFGKTMGKPKAGIGEQAPSGEDF